MGCLFMHGPNENTTYESHSASYGICAHLALISAVLLYFHQPSVGCNRIKDMKFSLCKIKAKQNRRTLDDSQPNIGSDRQVRLLLTAFCEIRGHGALWCFILGYYLKRSCESRQSLASPTRRLHEIMRDNRH